MPVAPLSAVRRLVALVLLAGAVVGGAGCGSADEGSRPDAAATLLLDFTPNAVHVGIYLALARDYTGAAGVDLTVQTPGTSTDATKLLLAGSADFAVMDIHDLAIARAKGRDLVGVMAIVERPLASIIAQPDVRSPKDLEGRRVGVTGLPSDDAVLDSIVRGDGGDPRKVRRTTIGFDAVPAILGGKVSGATAFWNDEGVALRAKRPKLKVFKVDDFGAPAYPELVLVTPRTTVQDDPDLVGATVAALQRGYSEALSDPASAVEALVDAVPGTGRALTARELDAVQPTFQAVDGSIGTLDLAGLRPWARWEQRFGIVKRVPEVAQMFVPRFAAAGAKQAAENSG